MTLKELFLSCKYQSVFNQIHKHFCKERYTYDQIKTIDVAYCNLFSSITKIKETDGLKNYSIFLEKLEDSSDFDIFLRDPSSGETYALDFVNWSDLLPLEIVSVNEISLPFKACLILWEITFWGLNRNDIKKVSESIL
jgi:hypothetical protein